MLLAAGTGLLTTSCVTKQEGNGVAITKVNPFHLDDYTKIIQAADPSILFNRDALLHGAISDKERRARQGNYFVIFWKAEDRSQPVTVRLEYTQKNTGLQVKKIEQEVADVRKSNTTKFEIIGDDYVVNGRVTSWKASLVRGKDVLVSYESYLWQ